MGTETSFGGTQPNQDRHASSSPLDGPQDLSGKLAPPPVPSISPILFSDFRSFGTYIRGCRKAQNLTQLQAGEELEKAGIRGGSGAISELERIPLDILRPKLLLELARIYDKPRAEIVGRFVAGLFPCFEFSIVERPRDDRLLAMRSEQEFDSNHFGVQALLMRNKANLTRQQASGDVTSSYGIKITVGQIVSLENGRIKTPDPRMLVALSLVYSTGSERGLLVQRFLEENFPMFLFSEVLPPGPAVDSLRIAHGS